jgi:LPXTG-motif cell wall-anchored protein
LTQDAQATIDAIPTPTQIQPTVTPIGELTEIEAQGAEGEDETDIVPIVVAGVGVLILILLLLALLRRRRRNA